MTHSNTAAGRSEADTAKQVLPFGTWPSTLTAEAVASQGRRLAEPQICDGRVFWLEMRPWERGRVQLVARSLEGTGRTLKCQDLLPDGFAARSRANEYGGGSYLATPGHVYFVNDADQCLYDLPLDGSSPAPLTPAGNRRFADLHLDAQRQRLLAVCEDHTAGGDEAIHRLVAIPLNGSQRLQTLAEGADFYSNPRLSPDGKCLSWLSWDHPAMPWDATRLWVAALNSEGDMTSPRCVAGGEIDESIFQPRWSPDGFLYYVSDRTNWWNIYRLTSDPLAPTSPTAEAVTDLDAEFATPQWTFNMSTYDFLDEQTLLATYTQNGFWQLATIDLRDKTIAPVASELKQFAALSCDPTTDRATAVFVAASPIKAPEVYHFKQGEIQPVTDSPAAMEPADIAVAKPISFDTTEDDRAHALFYAPQHRAVRGPTEDKPPVIVICHGGPTGATETSLNLKIQYWTQRGFAVLDVNYRGSTGYGREYRRKLYDAWGIRDLDDVCAAADYVSQLGWAHPQQRIIKGSSAGGYTVLAALVFRDTFDAGVSLYGVGDLELLARDTHKFEARYLDSLVGPYPQAKQSYIERSPLHYVAQLRCPLLVFQGLEDKVVPPNQAQSMVSAVAARGIPVAYVTYPNEGHGFRQADNVAHMLAAEQLFYQRIFKLDGGELPDDLLTLENSDAI